VITWLFAPEGPRRMALVRIVLALAMLLDTAPHWRYAVELYSTWGPAIPIFPAAISRPESSDEDHLPGGDIVRGHGFHAPLPGPLLAVTIHTALIYLLMCVALGWQTRVSLLGAATCFVWIGLLDLPGTFAKHSVIALHGLLLLPFSGCGRVWSIDSRREAFESACPLSAAWPRRLLQIMICSLYFGAALTKIRTPAFLSGDLRTFSLLNDQWGGGAFGQRLSMFPQLTRGCSLATILFEILFPVLIWVPRLRRWLLVGAFILHGLMGIALHIGTFSLIMFAVLLVFVREEDLELCRLPGIGGGRNPAAPPARRGSLVLTLSYVSLGGLFVGSGVLIQRSMDWYGAFGKHDPAAVATLKPIDARQFAEMEAARLPAWEDYVHRVRFGTRTSQWEVFGSSDRFLIGDRTYVLVQFILPHPELLLEGLLIAPDGAEVARFTHRVGEGFTHSINGFELTDELPSGRYRIVLQLQHEEFLRRTIEVSR